MADSLALTAPVAAPRPRPAAPPAPRLPERPALASGVLLHGEFAGTGFAQSQWLVQVDGRYLQLTELLYRVLEQVDGRRTLAEIAAAVAAATPWPVGADDVGFLLREKLLPLGVLATEAAAPRRKEAPSLLALTARKRMVSAEAIEPVARVMQWLFLPAVMVPLLVAIAVAHAWLFLTRGVDGILHQLFYTPGLMLLTLAGSFLPALLHEFGHAAALRYGGGRARSIGFGIYMMDTAFYTDVTDCYRLGRWGRIRVGLGGVYIDLVLSLLFVVGFVLTGHPWFVVLVYVTVFSVLDEFIPLGRFDGYWVLADLTGVPDFYSQMKPFLRSILPPRFRWWKGEKLPPLKPWVKLVFGLYTLVAMPALYVFLGLFLWHSPRILLDALGAIREQVVAIPVAVAEGNALLVGGLLSQVLLLGLALFGLVYFLWLMARSFGRLAGRLGAAAWRWVATRPTPPAAPRANAARRRQARSAATFAIATPRDRPARRRARPRPHPIARRSGARPLADAA